MVTSSLDPFNIMCLDISSINLFFNPLLFRWKIVVEPTNKRKICGIACELRFWDTLLKGIHRLEVWHLKVLSVPCLNVKNCKLIDIMLSISPFNTNDQIK
jgi:hypothetical protein